MILRALAIVLALVEPSDSVSSANGRYAADIRWPENIDSEPAIVAWYSAGPRGRTLFRELPVDPFSFHDILLPDSGRFLVTTRNLRYGCVGRAGEDDPLVTIYGVDGALVAAMKAGDVFEPFDLQHFDISATFTLRTESDGREVVVISVPVKDKSVERRVDVATGALLDEKGPIFPRPRVFVTPVDTSSSFEVPADCGAWQSSDILAVDSVQLLEAATHTPMPKLPLLIYRAGIRTMRLHVLIDESGDVLCAVASPPVFGIAEAAIPAVRQWRFRPFTRDGRAVKATGEVHLHFDVAR